MRLARETDAAADRAVAKEPDPFEAEYDMLVHDVKVGGSLREDPSGKPLRGTCWAASP